MKIRDTKPVSVTLHFSAAHRLKFQVLQWDGVAIALSQDQLSFRNSSRTWKVQGSDKRLCHEAHKDFRDQHPRILIFIFLSPPSSQLSLLYQKLIPKSLLHCQSYEPSLCSSA